MQYAVTLRFNSRVGGRQVRQSTHEAESIGDALEQALQAQERIINTHGGSICVTGVCVDELC